MQKQAHQMRDDITGLRAIAVISVIIFHLDKTILPGGYLGVDIFFVISGYVITLSLLKSDCDSFWPYLTQFYQKRVKRLMPALVVLVLVSSIWISLVDPAPRMSLLTGMAGLFGLSNMLLFFSATDYFSADTDFNIFTHTWSLGVEEQYYFVYPVLFWMFSHKLSKSISNKTLLAAIGVLSLSSFALFLWLSEIRPSAAFFLMPSRFWELGVGCMLCLAGQRYPAPNSTRSFSAAGPVAATVLLSCLFFPEDNSVWSTPVCVLSTAALLVWSRKNQAMMAVLSSPVFVWIGLASYSLYLWHWPVLVVGRWTTGVDFNTAIFQVTATFALGAMSYHLIETPLRRLRWSERDRGTILIGLGSAILVAFGVAALYRPLKGDLYLGEPRLVDQATASTLFDQEGQFATSIRSFADSCNLTPHLLTGPQKAPKPKISQDFLDQCLKGNSSGAKIVLLGDSFASRSAEHVALAAEELGLQFGILFGYNCPFPLAPQEIFGLPAESCREHDYAALQDAVIKSVQAGDIYVVRLYLAKDQYMDYMGSDLPRKDAYDFALTHFAERVHERGGRVVVLGGNPTLPIQAMQAMNPQWFNQALYTETISGAANPETIMDHALDAHMAQIFGDESVLTYLPINRWFCDASDECRIRTESEVYYLDKVHLSPAAYDLFFDELLNKMRGIARSSS